MDSEILRGYAALIAGSGVNVQKGQEVFIDAALDRPEFIAVLAEECYKLGASKVTVDWHSQAIDKISSNYCALETLSVVENYEEARLQHYVDKIPCRIYIESDDPDGMNGADQEKLTKARQARYSVIKPYRDKIENRYQWCIAAVPGPAWAKKVFPGLGSEDAEEKLWEAILSCSRALSDPVAAWEEHNRVLHEKCAFLNSLNIRKLHYFGDNGTDLTVGMIPQAVFRGGSELTLQNVRINPNIPSEECFISPMKGEAEGTVYSTMPLSYRGELIENFSIRFESGRAVEWHAEKNEDLLGQIICMDEGSRMLGECALVPVDSPIYKSGVLFYNTLFDENAACHLALGMGFADTIDNYADYTLEQCREMGVNDSMIHEDFMIGYEGLNIDAVCEDGRCVPVFRNGSWAV